MGNKTVGRSVDRRHSKPVIPEIHATEHSQYLTNPAEFIKSRYEYREKMEEWGYLWAHRILEDIYVRPNFDMKVVLDALKNNDLDSLMEYNQENGVEGLFNDSMSDMSDTSTQDDIEGRVGERLINDDGEIGDVDEGQAAKPKVLKK